MQKFLIIGKYSEANEYNTCLQLLKNEGMSDFLRHQTFVQSGKIPEWYSKYSSWYDTLNKFPTVFDYFDHEHGEFKERISERKKRGYFKKFIILGTSAKKKNVSAITKFSKEYDDVRIVTENQYKKLRGIK